MLQQQSFNHTKELKDLRHELKCVSTKGAIELLYAILQAYKLALFVGILFALIQAFKTFLNISITDREYYSALFTGIFGTTIYDFIKNYFTKKEKP